MIKKSIKHLSADVDQHNMRAQHLVVNLFDAMAASLDVFILDQGWRFNREKDGEEPLCCWIIVATRMSKEGTLFSRRDLLVFRSDG